MQKYAIVQARYSEIADFSDNVCVSPAWLTPTVMAPVPPVAVLIGGDYHRTIAETGRRQSGEIVMKILRSLILAFVAALAAGDAFAQADLRAPLPQPLKVKQGMLNVPALSPLWLLPEEAAKYNIQIEMVMFQRFSDARTALVSGDLQL